MIVTYVEHILGAFIEYTWECCGEKIASCIVSWDETPFHTPTCSKCGAEGDLEMAVEQPNPNGEVSAQMLKQLREMKERWNNSKKESQKMGGGGTTLRSGEKYLTRLSRARMYSGQNGLGFVLEFTCVEGDQTGEKGVRIHTLDTDEKITNAQRDLRRLGLEVDEVEIEQLPTSLAKLEREAPGVRIKVQDSPDGKYVNTYIDKLVDLGNESPLPPSASSSRPAPARPAPAAGSRVPPRQTAPQASPPRPPAPRPPAGPPAGKTAPTAPQNPRPVAPARVVPAAPAPQPVEEVIEEPVAEEAVVGETFEIGMPVRLVLQGTALTGTVHALSDTAGEGKLHIRRDDTKKLIAVSIETAQVSALIPTPEPEAEEVIEEEVVEEPAPLE